MPQRNTRLQVEHPVTEMIVGQDLVEWQIRVANGEHLPLSQAEVPLTGHAFEARIYAENVPKGFLPAAGVLCHYDPVPVSSTVRVETGVEQGDTVSMHYDPMIAKLVVWGEDRGAALVKMKDCLSKFQVAGVPTNINFLQRLTDHWAFEAGQVETHFIEHFKTDLLNDPNDTTSKTEPNAAAFVAACLCQKEHLASTQSLVGPNSLNSLWYAHPPFRSHHLARRTMEFEWESEYDTSGSHILSLDITYQPDGSYLVQTGNDDSSKMRIKVWPLDQNKFRIEADGFMTNVSLADYSKEV